MQTFTEKSNFTITNDHHECFNTLKPDLPLVTCLTLCLAKPGLQYIILCADSFHGTGFVLMIEDYWIDQKGEKEKITLQYVLVRDILQQLNRNFQSFIKTF